MHLIFEYGGLQAPWKITDVIFKTSDAARRELHLRIRFVTGSKFKDEVGVDCAVHDTIERQWQHQNFFEHHLFLTLQSTAHHHQ